MGKSFIKPTDFNVQQIQDIIWTALDIRLLSKKSEVKLNFIKDANILLLIDQPTLKTQTSLASAANLLQVHVNTIVDHEWDGRTPHMADVGKYLSICSDLVFCKSKHQTKIESIAANSQVPIICTKSSMFNLLQTLTDMMTIQLHFGRLKNLNLAWIGPPCPLMNTYLCIAPVLGMNMYFCCSDDPDSGICPAMYKAALNIGKQTKAHVMEVSDVSSAVKGADVIAVKKHERASLKITSTTCMNASKDWCLLHSLPRGDEIDLQLFRKKNTTVWKSVENLKWIYAAIMLRLLRPYQHFTNRPNFD